MPFCPIKKYRVQLGNNHCGVQGSIGKLEGVLTPRRAERSMLCARLEPGSGSGIRNKAIIISAKQQSHMEEYGVVHGSSNHTRKNTKNTAYCTWSE